MKRVFVIMALLSVLLASKIEWVEAQTLSQESCDGTRNYILVRPQTEGWDNTQYPHNLSYEFINGQPVYYVESNNTTRRLRFDFTTPRSEINRIYIETNNTNATHFVNVKLVGPAMAFAPNFDVSMGTKFDPVTISRILIYRDTSLGNFRVYSLRLYCDNYNPTPTPTPIVVTATPPSWTNTPTWTPVVQVVTATPSNTPDWTATPTNTPLYQIVTATPSNTPDWTPTPTWTPVVQVVTATPTDMIPPTETTTPLPPTETNTPLPATETNTPLPATATFTPVYIVVTATPTPEITLPITPTNTPYPTATPTDTPTPTPTATFTPLPIEIIDLGTGETVQAGGIEYSVDAGEIAIFAGLFALLLLRLFNFREVWEGFRKDQ